MHSLKERLVFLLEWSERYTKTDMVYFASGSFWLTLGQGVSTLAAFGLSVVFANFVSPEVNGMYRYIIAIAGILSITTLSGINTAVTRSIAQTGNNIALSGFVQRSRYGLIGGAVGLIIALYYLLNGNGTLSAAFLITSLFLPFFDSLSMYDALLQGKKDFKASALSKLSIQIFAVVCMSVSAVLSGNLVIIVIVYFIAWALGRALSFFIALGRYKPVISADSQTLKYGRRLSFLGAFSTTIGYLDKLLVFHFFGAASLAAYYFATAPVLQTRMLGEVFSILALPKLSSRSVTSINKYFYWRLLQLFLLGATISSLYIVTAPYFFKLFFPAYGDAILFSQVFSLTIAVSLPLAYLSSVFRSKIELIKQTYIVDIGSNIILLALLVSLTFMFGIMGMVVARTLAPLFGFLLSIFVWRNAVRSA